MEPAKSYEKGTEGESNDLVLGRVDAQGFCGLLIFNEWQSGEARI